MRELETERAAPSLGASEQSWLCEEKEGKKSSRGGWLTQLWRVPWAVETKSRAQAWRVSPDVRKRTQHSAQTGWGLTISHLMVLRRDGGLQDLPRRGGPGSHPRLPDTGDAGKLLPGVGEGGEVGEGCWDWAYKDPQASSPSGPEWTDSSVPTGGLRQRKLWRRQHHSEPLGFSKHNVQHATKKAKEGITTNRTKRKRTEPDPEVWDMYQHIRGMLEVSDANVTCSKIYLTKGEISENQNQSRTLQ